MHIGHNITKVRELKGITQCYVAKMLNVSQQAYSKLEKQEYIDNDKLREIANILDCSINVIKNYSEEKILQFLNRDHQQNNNS
ncbi:MAG: helix-turn-helix transcriptional regulator [Chitinophagales bacterium]|nr:helix-turn-helix transcriptional regulator [Chitinophagales bacterium]